MFAYLDVSEMSETDCFNHSCDPSAGWQISARCDIAADEEITFDDATCMAASFAELDCLCGASNCRGRITGEDWKLPGLQERLRGYFQPYIEEKVNQVLMSASDSHIRYIIGLIFNF